MKLLLFTSYRGWSHGRKWLEYLATRHDVHVATFKDFGERIPGVTVHPILGTAAADERATPSNATPAGGDSPWLTLRIGVKFERQFAALIDELRPDVVHAHQSVPFGWYALRAVGVSSLKLPLIVSVWGTDVMAFAERHWLYRWINRRVLNGATLVTATGVALRDAAYRWTKRRDVVLVPFGVDTSHFTPKPAAPDHARVFGIAKQLKAHTYGVELAVEALALARKQNADLSLEIAGDGPARAEFTALAERLGVDDNVRFLGSISQPDMPRTMQRWDAYLLPSRQESFGVSALEAQAVGLPVLAARTGGIPEVVRDGVTARFVEPLDAEHLAAAMVALAGDRSLLASAYSEGPRWVHERYEWADCGKQMEQLYADVAKAALAKRA